MTDARATELGVRGIQSHRAIFALIGPTAVGKTDVALEVARELDAEILGCDSMQVYRRMAILTQQPTAAQRADVPHHLIDCIEPSELFSVGQYREAAMAAIAQIQARDRAVLAVGGTGLYLRALIDGLCEAPAGDPAVRDRLWSDVGEQGSPALFARLQRVDPTAASRIHPHDARRVVRALEVFEMTGRPLSSYWHEQERLRVPALVVGLTRDRAELYARIDRRVERMLRDERVVEEVQQLDLANLSRTARQVHGLPYLEPFLRGELSQTEMMPAWQQQVRNYAKRQWTWFRAEPRIHWITMARGQAASQTTEEILAAFRLGGKVLT